MKPSQKLTEDQNNTAGRVLVFDVPSLVAQVVKTTRQAHDMSLRAFADALSTPMASLSYQVIKNWEDGVALPQPKSILPIMLQFTDWRRDFAHDLMAALHPEMNQPASEIGRRIINNAPAQPTAG